MPSERQAALEILKSAPGHRLDFSTLAQRLVTTRALGFGVDPEDLVYWLKSAGDVDYDPRTELVTLKNK